MGTHDSNPPPVAARAAQPRRRMVLRKIGQATPLPSPASPASPAPRTAQARSSIVPTPSTILPPAANEDAAVPIPLTRLHTPRPRFRSAIDLSPLPGGDESPVRETSTSTLPPLVASLPPVSPPIYVPAPSRGARSGAHVGPMMVLGAAAAIAALAILGGVVVGRRISPPALPARVAASEMAPPVAADAPVVSPPPAIALPPAASVAAHATSEQAGAIAVDGVTPVENLPKVAVEPQARLVPVYARPAARPVASPSPAAVPATVAAPAAPKTEAVVRAKAAVEAAGQDGAKNPVSPDEGASPLQPSQATQTTQATKPAEPDVDPLVKAVRDDIQEEEAARKKQSR